MKSIFISISHMLAVIAKTLDMAQGYRKVRRLRRESALRDALLVKLLSSSIRLASAEKRWVEEHSATVARLGSFRPGRNFAPLRTTMVRKQKPTGQG